MLKLNKSLLNDYFQITERGSTIRQEVIAGLTTFLAMLYSVIIASKNIKKASCYGKIKATITV